MNLVARARNRGGGPGWEGGMGAIDGIVHVASAVKAGVLLRACATASAVATSKTSRSARSNTRTILPIRPEQIYR